MDQKRHYYERPELPFEGPEDRLSPEEELESFIAAGTGILPYEKRALRRWVNSGHSVFEVPPGAGCHWESYLEWYRSDLKLRRDLAGKSAIGALDYLREGQTDIFLDVPHFSSMKETAMWLYELAINEKTLLRDLLRYISTHLLLEDCGRQSFDWTTALSCILEQTNWTDLVDENTEQFLILTKEVNYPEFLLF